MAERAASFMEDGGQQPKTAGGMLAAGVEKEPLYDLLSKLSKHVSSMV